MDRFEILSRIETIRREIAQIRAMNRIYQAQPVHSDYDKNLHQEPKDRLQEIVIELHELGKDEAA